MGCRRNLGQLDLVRRLQDRSSERYSGEASDGTCALGSTGASTSRVDTLAGDGCPPGTEGAAVAGSSVPGWHLPRLPLGTRRRAIHSTQHLCAWPTLSASSKRRSSSTATRATASSRPRMARTCSCTSARSGVGLPQSGGRAEGRVRHHPGPAGTPGGKRQGDRLPRVGSTRFSMHFYNSSDDVDRALAALDEVLQ
jgi:hypothetical protein